MVIGGRQIVLIWRGLKLQGHTVCASCFQFFTTGTASPFIFLLLLTTLTSGPNLCMIAAENAAPANNRR